ncbi:L,D-transpeptidase-like protein [Nocardia ignorata]|uniref:L,D-transpeptidase-like protein n=1 Tax=Nocardia ignorata TaxID=145285 RepID=A0A4R6PQT4_NOCIG|nr:L,D-transpeptidase-like protein [Nocardia ignorata]
MTEGVAFMRNALRFLFVAIMAALLAASWSGAASADLIGDQRTQYGGGTYAEADLSNHTFTVTANGETRVMPASMGKPGFETPTGTFSVLEKDRAVVFDSRTIGIPLDDPEGYIIDGEYAVRLTWGGVMVHSAPWSVDSQGNANVSHGCINLSPENAAWYYENVGIGDQVYIHW